MKLTTTSLTNTMRLLRRRSTHRIVQRHSKTGKRHLINANTRLKERTIQTPSRRQGITLTTRRRLIRVYQRLLTTTLLTISNRRSRITALKGDERSLLPLLQTTHLSTTNAHQISIKRLTRIGLTMNTRTLRMLNTYLSPRPLLRLTRNGSNMTRTHPASS